MTDGRTEEMKALEEALKEHIKANKGKFKSMKDILKPVKKEEK